MKNQMIRTFCKIPVSNCHSFFIEFRTTYLNDVILVPLAFLVGLRLWTLSPLHMGSYGFTTGFLHLSLSPIYLCLPSVYLYLGYDYPSFHFVHAVQRSVQSLVLGTLL